MSYVKYSGGECRPLSLNYSFVYSFCYWQQEIHFAWKRRMPVFLFYHSFQFPEIVLCIFRESGLFDQRRKCIINNKFIRSLSLYSLLLLHESHFVWISVHQWNFLRSYLSYTCSKGLSATQSLLGSLLLFLLQIHFGFRT